MFGREIPGSTRKHAHLLIDPEFLIACTPHLGAADPRLLGLVFDWCAAHGALLSKARIKAMAPTFGKDVQPTLARFNGALAQHGIDRAPAYDAGTFNIERRAMALPSERPALLRLRMRTLIGVTARSEVLTERIATRQNTLNAEELTVAGTTRRCTDRVLAELLQGGFTTAIGKQRGRQFALADLSAFIALFRQGTSGMCTPINWYRVLQAVVIFNTLPGLDRLSDTLKRVETGKIRDELAGLMTRLHPAQPPIITGKTDAFEQLKEWSVIRMESWADEKSVIGA